MRACQQFRPPRRHTAFSSATSVSRRLNALYRAGRYAICGATITRPDTAAANKIAGGTAPAGSDSATPDIADPATAKARVTPPVTNGHTSKANRMKEIPSQAANWTIRIIAPWPTSIRSRRWQSATPPAATLNARFTIQSVQRVTQPLTRAARSASR